MTSKGKHGVKHKPTKELRGQVESMSAYGVPQEQIALVIGIDRKTLAKHYREELDTASVKANARIAGNLYKKAMGGCTTSMLFWLKTRAKWKETSVHEIENTKEPVTVIIKKD